MRDLSLQYEFGFSVTAPVGTRHAGRAAALFSAQSATVFT